MATRTMCTLASLSAGTVLDVVFRFEMWSLRLPMPRRIGSFPGIEDGIVQDFGIDEFDRKILGQPYVTQAQSDTLKSMYESATTYWAFSDGTTLWKVYFLNLEKLESFGNKIIYEIELGVKEKLL